MQGVVNKSIRRTMTEQWQENPYTLFKYENLINLAKPNGVVKLEQSNCFFVFTHPKKINSFTVGAPFLGWKLHLSVCIENLTNAFNLAAPIISRYCTCFKVINTDVVRNGRYFEGAQITIYLEEQEKQAIAVEDLEKMMGEINQLFSEKKIDPGRPPEWDAPTFSPFFSMRNDKCKTMCDRKLVGFMPSHTAGKHFNPMNNPNPFGALLNTRKNAFDPLEHFMLFDLGNNDGNIPYRCIDTLKACINEYTIFDRMDIETQEDFIRQYKHGHGKNVSNDFLKEAYCEQPDVLLAVQLAFLIIFTFENDKSLGHSKFHECINLTHLSERYSYDNSYRKLLPIIEEYSHGQSTKRVLSHFDMYIQKK